MAASDEVSREQLMNSLVTVHRQMNNLSTKYGGQVPSYDEAATSVGRRYAVEHAKLARKKADIRNRLASLED